MVFAVAPSEVASFPESHTSGQLKSSALADSLPAAAHLAARLGCYQGGREGSVRSEHHHVIICGGASAHLLKPMIGVDRGTRASFREVRGETHRADDDPDGRADGEESGGGGHGGVDDLCVRKCVRRGRVASGKRRRVRLSDEKPQPPVAPAAVPWVWAESPVKFFFVKTMRTESAFLSIVKLRPKPPVAPFISRAPSHVEQTRWRPPSRYVSCLDSRGVSGASRETHVSRSRVPGAWLREKP